MAEIVLLDEPTSGLDAFTARYLVSSLADLAHNQGKIVLLTIHQPRSDIFRMFDQVGIMSHGKTVYFGGSEQMLEYFDKLGYPCPTYTNPTDHYGMFPTFVINRVCPDNVTITYLRPFHGTARKRHRKQTPIRQEECNLNHWSRSLKNSILQEKNVLTNTLYSTC